ncbi:unnamed protein product, partial [Urochloa humidicola]
TPPPHGPTTSSPAPRVRDSFQLLSRSSPPPCSTLPPLAPAIGPRINGARRHPSTTRKPASAPCSCARQPPHLTPAVDRRRPSTLRSPDAAHRPFRLRISPAGPHPCACLQLVRNPCRRRRRPLPAAGFCRPHRCTHHSTPPLDPALDAGSCSPQPPSASSLTGLQRGIRGWYHCWRSNLAAAIFSSSRIQSCSRYFLPVKDCYGDFPHYIKVCETFDAWPPAESAVPYRWRRRAGQLACTGTPLMMMLGACFAIQSSPGLLLAACCSAASSFVAGLLVKLLAEIGAQDDYQPKESGV